MTTMKPVCITTHQTQQPGDATLVTSDQTLSWGGRDLSTVLYTDDGRLYAATPTPGSPTGHLVAPESTLAAQIRAGHTQNPEQFTEARAEALTAAGGDLTTARDQMAQATFGGSDVLSTTPVGD